MRIIAVTLAIVLFCVNSGICSNLAPQAAKSKIQQTLPDPAEHLGAAIGLSGVMSYGQEDNWQGWVMRLLPVAIYVIGMMIRNKKSKKEIPGFWKVLSRKHQLLYRAIIGVIVVSILCVVMILPIEKMYQMTNAVRFWVGIPAALVVIGYGIFLLIKKSTYRKTVSLLEKAETQENITDIESKLPFYLVNDEKLPSIIQENRLRVRQLLRARARKQQRPTRPKRIAQTKKPTAAPPAVKKKPPAKKEKDRQPPGKKKTKLVGITHFRKRLNAFRQEAEQNPDEPLHNLLTSKFRDIYATLQDIHSQYRTHAGEYEAIAQKYLNALKQQILPLIINCYSMLAYAVDNDEIELRESDITGQIQAGFDEIGADFLREDSPFMQWCENYHAPGPWPIKIFSDPALPTAPDLAVPDVTIKPPEGDMAIVPVVPDEPVLRVPEIPVVQAQPYPIEPWRIPQLELVSYGFNYQQITRLNQAVNDLYQAKPFYNPLLVYEVIEITIRSLVLLNEPNQQIADIITSAIKETTISDEDEKQFAGYDDPVNNCRLSYNLMIFFAAHLGSRDLAYLRDIEPARPSVTITQSAEIADQIAFPPPINFVIGDDGACYIPDKETLREVFEDAGCDEAHHTASPDLADEAVAIITKFLFDEEGEVVYVEPATPPVYHNACQITLWLDISGASEEYPNLSDYVTAKLDLAKWGLNPDDIFVVVDFDSKKREEADQTLNWAVKNALDVYFDKDLLISDTMNSYMWLIISQKFIWITQRLQELAPPGNLVRTPRYRMDKLARSSVSVEIFSYNYDPAITTKMPRRHSPSPSRAP